MKTALGTLRRSASAQLNKKYGTITTPPITTSHKDSEEARSKAAIAVLHNAPKPNNEYAQSIFIDKNSHIKAANFRSDLAKSEETLLSALGNIDEKDRSVINNDFNLEVIAKSFNPESWRQFSRQHLHPQAVANLKLDTSPARITSYNLCITPDAQSEEGKRKVRNRSKALGLFPLLEKIIQKNSYEGITLLSLLDLGSSAKPHEKLKKHLQMPNATTGFMKRISHASSVDISKSLYDVFFEGLVDKKGVINEKEYKKRIDSIPLPITGNKAECDAMWKVLETLERTNLNPKAKSQIFFNASKNWQRNAQAINSSNFTELLQQYSSKIADDLILPVYVNKYKEDTGASRPFSGLMTDRFNKFEDWFTIETSLKISDFVNENIVSTLSPLEIIQYAKRLDKQTTTINKARPLFIERMNRFNQENYESYPGWHKLFPDQEFNGVKFKVLTTDEELKNEGKEMHNCVPGLDYKCRQGSCHIISGLYEKEEVLENGELQKVPERFSMRLDIHGNGFKLFEASTAHNKFVSEHVRNTVDAFCKEIDEGRIELNPLRGSISTNFTISEALGFDIRDEESLDGVFNAYKESRTLPKNMKEFTKSREDFFQKIGLDNFLETHIPESVKRSREDKPSDRVEKFMASKVKKGPREIAYID